MQDAFGVNAVTAADSPGLELKGDWMIYRPHESCREMQDAEKGT